MPDAKPKPPPIRKDIDLASLDRDRARDVLAGFLTVDLRAGVVQVLGVRYMLCRPQILVNIQKQLEQTVGPSTKGFLYLAGEKSAEEGLDEVRALMQGVSIDRLSMETFPRLVDAFALLGYGRSRMLSSDPAADRFQLALDDSPIADAYGPSKKPVCHLFAGFYGGVWRHLLKEEYLCEEISCKAQGHPYCMFDLQPTPSA